MSCPIVSLYMLFFEIGALAPDRSTGSSASCWVDLRALNWPSKNTWLFFVMS